MRGGGGLDSTNDNKAATHNFFYSFIYYYFFIVIVEVKNCVLHTTPLLHEVPKSINGLGVDHYQNKTVVHVSSTNKISQLQSDITLLYWDGTKILISSGPLFRFFVKIGRQRELLEHVDIK